MSPSSWASPTEDTSSWMLFRSTCSPSMMTCSGDMVAHVWKGYISYLLSFFCLAEYFWNNYFSWFKHGVSWLSLHWIYLLTVFVCHNVHQFEAPFLVGQSIMKPIYSLLKYLTRNLKKLAIPTTRIALQRFRCTALVASGLEVDRYGRYGRLGAFLVFRHSHFRFSDGIQICVQAESLSAESIPHPRQCVQRSRRQSPSLDRQWQTISYMNYMEVSNLWGYPGTFIHL